MMDANKAEKLAAAKKKLKQFQQKSGTKSPNIVTSQTTLIQDEFEKTTNLNNGVASATQISDSCSISENHEVSSSYIGREEELMQTINTLTAEKNDLVTSNNESQKVIQELLVIKLDYEEKAADKESEKALLIQQLMQADTKLKNTVSILIEEKNDLAAAHSHCQTVLKTMEEDSIQLKKDFKSVQENLNSLQSAHQKNEDAKPDHSALIDELRSLQEEMKIQNQLHSDLNEEFKELQIRHSNQLAELQLKDSVIKDLKSQIEMLSLNLEQMKNASPENKDANLEKENVSHLEEEVRDLRDKLSKLSTEKEVLATQYQQYILRLNGQIRTINSQAESMALEKRNVEAALESKKERISELETALADLKKERELVSTSLPSENIPRTDEMTQENSSTANVAVYATEIENLQKRISGMVLDNDQLAALVVEKESRIQELEIRIDRYQSELNIATANQPNSEERAKLLQAMQSDKLAASRAISQNRQLKNQLEELEKAFIQMSNDKLVLTEQNQADSRLKKELSEKIISLEPEVLQSRQQVKELESQRNATIYWRQELEEAHERIEALSHQNTELKKRVVWNLGADMNDRKPRQDNGNETEHRPHSSSENGEDSDWVDEPVPYEQHQKLLFHHEQLEKQFQRVMGTVASLTEEKQKAEHLVLQLQSETETIGEYVSLYQEQRGLLHRKAEQLAKERHQLKERIEKLTQLLPRLAPQLEKLPQWLQLQSDPVVTTITCVEDEEVVAEETFVPTSPTSLDQIASNVANVLLEITSSSLSATAVTDNYSEDPYPMYESSHAPHENFHPCSVCSGRLMTV